MFNIESIIMCIVFRMSNSNSIDQVWEAPNSILPFEMFAGDQEIHMPEWKTVSELITWANERGMEVEPDEEGCLTIHTNLVYDENENLIPFEMMAE